MKEFLIENVKLFDPVMTFDCGQTFRYELSEKGIECVFRDLVLEIYKEDDNLKIISSKDISEEYFKSEIIPYLSLDEDYEKINENIISCFGKYNDTINNAISVSKGIRILKQDHFETLISFIISQNNNIPRIKKIIKSLCEKYGEKFTYKDKEYYSFPTCETLEKAECEDIRACGTGFRDKYIKSACKLVSEKEIDFEKLEKADYEEQMNTLMKISGVGPKVANCFILYSLHNLSAFPIDVWIKRVIDKYYKDGLDYDSLGEYAGVAQQYLFYYERYKNGEI